MAVYIQGGGNPVPAAQAAAPAPGIDAFAQGLQSGNQFVSEFVRREQALDEIARQRREEQRLIEDRAAEAYRQMLGDQGATQGVPVGAGGPGAAAGPGGGFMSPEVQAGLTMQAAAEQVAASDAQVYADAVAAQEAERQSARMEGRRTDTFEDDRALVNSLLQDGVLSTEDMLVLEQVAPQLAGQVNPRGIAPSIGPSMTPFEAAGEVGRIQRAADQYFGAMESQTPVEMQQLEEPAANPMVELGEPASFLPSPAKLVDFLRTSEKPELANMDPASREAFLQRYRQHYDRVQTKFKGMVLEAQQNALNERVDRVETMLMQQNSQFTRKRQMAPDALRSLAQAYVKGDDAMVKSMLSSADVNTRADMDRALERARLSFQKRKYEEPLQARRAASDAAKEVERLEESLEAAISAGNTEDEAAARTALQNAELQREDAFAALDAFDPNSSENYRKARQEEQELEKRLLAIEDRELSLDELEDANEALSQAEQLLERTREEHAAQDAADLERLGSVSPEYLQRQESRRAASQEIERRIDGLRTQQRRAEEAAREADSNLNIINRESPRPFRTREQVEAAKEQAALKKRQLTADVSKAEADARKAEFESDPEVIEANREVEKAKIEASLAKSAAEIRVAELRVKEAERKAEEARNKAARGGADGMTEAQFFTQRMSLMRQLSPDDAQLAQAQVSLQQTQSELFTQLAQQEQIINSEIGRNSPSSPTVVAARNGREGTLKRLGTLDQQLTQLLQTNSKKLADKLKDNPMLDAQLKDLDRRAERFGATPLYYSTNKATSGGQRDGAVSTESPPPSATETTTVTVTENTPNGSFSAPPVTPAIQSVLETWGAQWDGNAYVLSSGQRMTPERLKRLEAEGKL
jgi:hypothetical protein